MLPPGKPSSAGACPQTPSVALGTSSDEILHELQHLLPSISNHGTTHLGEIETDLRQTGYLLTGAIDKLSKSFLGIHAALSAQHCLMARLLGGEAPSPALRAALARLQEEADAHVTAAVTGLQFQDMTTQLIGRILGHVGNLREVAVAVGSAGTTLCSDNNLKATALRPGAAVPLEALNRLLDEQNGVLRNGVRKAVAQTHMDSGDIELF